MDEFEAIVIGQFPPIEWYDYELADRFPGLEPVSQLGQLAIELEMGLIKTQSTGDQNSATAWRIIVGKSLMFDTVYQNISDHLSNINDTSQGTAIKLASDWQYPMIVTSVIHAEIKRVRTYSPYIREQKVVKDFSLRLLPVYLKEADKHFLTLRD